MRGKNERFAKYKWEKQTIVNCSILLIDIVFFYSSKIILIYQIHKLY